MTGWSTDTRDLVAATIAAHVGQEYMLANGHGELSCSCGVLVLDLPAPVEPYWDAAWEPMLDAFEAHRADAVLTALTEAGALLPAGGEKRDEVGFTRPGGETPVPCDDGAYCVAAEHHSHRRSVYYGPWQEVE